MPDKPHDTDPTPVRGTPETSAPPLPAARTVSDDMELAPPPPLPTQLRAKRMTISTVGAAAKRTLVIIIKAIGRHADKVVTAVMSLVLALVLAWTQRIDAKADNADAVAGAAAAQGATGAATAVKTKVETAVTYDATKEKANSTADDMKKLADRINELQAEVDRLKSKSGRPRVRRKPITLSPKTEKPLPKTPEAAVKEAASAPTPEEFQ